MKRSKRKKLIAIALVATLACSGSVINVSAATNEDTEITNYTDVLPFTDEETVEENEPTEDVESEMQTGLNEQEEHTEDEITINDETVMSLAPAVAVNNPASVLPKAGEVAIDATNFPDLNFRHFVKQYDTDNNGSFSVAITNLVCWM